MNKKADVSVVINNKEYIICGYESTEHMEKIATYINKKQRALEREEGYGMFDRDLKSILLAINIADDYLKAMEKIEFLEKERSKMRDEIYDLKHELILQKSVMEQL